MAKITDALWLMLFVAFFVSIVAFALWAPYYLVCAVGLHGFAKGLAYVLGVLVLTKNFSFRLNFTWRGRPGRGTSKV